MSWEVVTTDDFDRWWETLTQKEQDSITAAARFLEEKGPALGRPLVDTVSGSRHRNMKELRPPGGHIRILFAFDPRRAAILLIGGDKTNQWQTWYDKMIPVADRLYDTHRAGIERQGA